MGGIYGCGCKVVYILPHIIYPYSPCIYMFFFAAAYSFIKKNVLVLVQVLFVIKFNV